MNVPMEGPFDVAILGAGLVGLAAAAALAQEGLAVALLDRGPISAPAPDPAWDARVFAISPGSARLLEAVGAWEPDDRHPRRAPILEMRVFGDRGAELNFSAWASDQPALGWIVENRILLQGLHRALAPHLAAGRIVAMRDAEAVSVEVGAAQARLGFASGSELTARLLVAADGAHSWLREASGFTERPEPYGHTALVGNFECEHGHDGRAWQWFRPDGGTLAWLPLPGRRISIVWSTADSEARRLGALPAAELAGVVAEAGHHVLGRLDPIGVTALFPLGIVRAGDPTRPRVLLLGDAAHAIHPLAGQGVNLGFGDVADLAAVLRGRAPITDAGAAALLQRYRLRRAEPVAAMQRVTDGLWHLFNRREGWLAVVRNIGMSCLERLPPVKRALMQPALR